MIVLLLAPTLGVTRIRPDAMAFVPARISVLAIGELNRRLLVVEPAVTLNEVVTVVLLPAAQASGGVGRQRSDLAAGNRGPIRVANGGPTAKNRRGLIRGRRGDSVRRRLVAARQAETQCSADIANDRPIDRQQQRIGIGRGQLHGRRAGIDRQTAELLAIRSARDIAAGESKRAAAKRQARRACNDVACLRAGGEESSM